MMIAFKILMILCTIVSFLGSIGEKNDKTRNSYTALYAISVVILLLSILATNLM